MKIKENTVYLSAKKRLKKSKKVLDKTWDFVYIK